MGFLETTAAGFWDTLIEMAPYLLFGFAVAGALSVLIPASLVERHLGGRGVLPSVKAAAFGVPLPLCSCGVIPVAASLRRHGASRGATTAFLISTPQTGVDSILVTLSLLGPVFAVFRPFAAFAAGVLGGSLVDGLERGEETAAPKCEEACCSGERRGSRVAAALRYGFVALPEDIGRSLLVGLLLAGLITALVPKDLASLVGTGLVGMLVMMALGLPIYVCATASVPIAAALIAKGVSPGAAFVFLMTGPATNAATVATVWRTLGRRTAVAYVATVAVSALALGALLDLIYTHTGTAPAPHGHELLPHAAKLASAVALLVLLAVPIARRAFAAAPHGHEHGQADGPESLTLDIRGMTCSQCAASVTRALAELEGVATADVDLQRRQATVTGAHLDPARLRAAVEALGYTVADPDAD